MAGRLIDFIGQGDEVDLPVAADMPAKILVGAASLYYCRDSHKLFMFNEGSIAWDQPIALANFADLLGLDLTGLADGDVLTYDLGTTSWIVGQKLSDAPNDGNAYVRKSGAWAIGGGTPWYWNPPLAADFTGSYVSSGSAITLTDDSDVGLMVDATGIATSSEAIVFKAPPVGVDWEVTIHVRCDTVPFDYWNNGLFLYEASTHKMIQIGFGNNAGLWLDTVRSNSGGFVSRGATNRITSMDMFFRFHYNHGTTTFTSYYSHTGKQWTLYDTFALTSFFSAGPDGVGLGATFDKNKFVCDMWVQDW